jgi:hypothetical protein
MAPSWIEISALAARAPSNPKTCPTRIKWPVDETGRNSVSPSTIPKIVARPGPHSFMRYLSMIGCAQTASLRHIHKVVAVRQARREISGVPHEDLRGQRTANLLTKWKAWHTPNTKCRDIVLFSHARQVCRMKSWRRHWLQIPRAANCGKTIEIYENCNGRLAWFN